MELSLSALMEKNRTFIQVSKPKMNEHHNVGLTLVGVSRTLVQIFKSSLSSTLCCDYFPFICRFRDFYPGVHWPKEQRNSRVQQWSEEQCRPVCGSVCLKNSSQKFYHVFPESGCLWWKMEICAEFCCFRSNEECDISKWLKCYMCMWDFMCICTYTCA